MSVIPIKLYVRRNGAWQELVITPKMRVNGAWQSATLYKRSGSEWKSTEGA